jgi:GTP-binding protein
MSPRSTVPIVAIVGRPNVGKSTLFNRYAGHRRALVEDSPGITRDRIAEEIQAGDRRVLLVDTAGLDPAARTAEGDLTQAVQAQARSAVEDADAILLVVDAKAGLLPEDEDLARTLRRTRKPLAVAVNKIDVPAHKERVSDFYRLGLEPLRAVSAEHGSGAFEVLEELVARLPETEAAAEPEAEGEIRVALVGRPNVGKSSLVNRLAGEQRVVVSSQPGTTRDAIDIRLERDEECFVLVDTAGLRRPGRRTRIAERGSALMAVRSIERARVALLVIDAAEGFTDQDAAVARLVRDRGCAAALLANKWDLVPAERRPELLEQIQHGIRFMSDTPVVSVSAKTGSRVTRIFPLVSELARAGEIRVGTAELNRWLEESVQRHPPSMARRGSSRRPIKFFYATQTGVSPPTFVLFCTDPRAIKPEYRRFLERRLRERFGFEGTAVRLQLRARSEG